jgi:hypothetical protein
LEEVEEDAFPADGRSLRSPSSDLSSLSTTDEERSGPSDFVPVPIKTELLEPASPLMIATSPTLQQQLASTGSMSPDSSFNDLESHSTASSHFTPYPQRALYYPEQAQSYEYALSYPHCQFYGPGYDLAYPVHTQMAEAGFLPHFYSHPGYGQGRPSLPNIHEPVHDYDRRFSLPRYLPRPGYDQPLEDRSTLEDEPLSACSFSSSDVYLQSPVFSPASACSTPLTATSSLAPHCVYPMETNYVEMEQMHF